MRQVFADSGFWIALLNSRDELHDRAKRITASLGEIQIITSEWVLTEVLNCFAERGAFLRQAAARTILRLADRPGLRVVPFGEMSFQQAFELYESRPDKAWSVTDCPSFLIMRRLGISDALTHDRHFEQAGFRALLRSGTAPANP